MRGELLEHIEVYISKHDPTKTHEEIFAEFERVMIVHSEFDRHCKANKIKFTMPRKSQKTLARRKAFINWYVNKHQNRPLAHCVKELTRLTFASEMTIYDTIYGRR